MVRIPLAAWKKRGQSGYRRLGKRLLHQSEQEKMVVRPGCSLWVAGGADLGYILKTESIVLTEVQGY